MVDPIPKTLRFLTASIANNPCFYYPHAENWCGLSISSRSLAFSLGYSASLFFLAFQLVQWLGYPCMQGFAISWADFHNNQDLPFWAIKRQRRKKLWRNFYKSSNSCRIKKWNSTVLYTLSEIDQANPDALRKNATGRQITKTDFQNQ